MFVRLLPLIAGLAPVLGANVALVIGVLYETIPACFPYVDGCVSISATGRQPPGSFLFRAVHLPYATVLAGTWYFAWAWLKSVSPDRHATKRAVMLVLGLIASLALIVYVTFLGTTEPVYEFMRRGGIYFYFAAATLAQIAFTTAFLAEARKAADPVLERYANAMLYLCLSPFVLGLVNLVQKMALSKAVSDPIENSIEWIAALLMQAWYVVLYLLWRRTGFEVVVRSGTAERSS